MHDKLGLTVADWRKLAASKELELEVVSDSMYPTLHIGDKVKVIPLKDNRPEKGVVTVFFRGSEYPPLVVHRCVGPMTFRGDNRVYNDPPVTEGQLVGVVEEFLRGDQVRTVSNKSRVSLRIFLKLIYVRTRAFLSVIKHWLKNR